MALPSVSRHLLRRATHWPHATSGNRPQRPMGRNPNSASFRVNSLKETPEKSSQLVAALASYVAERRFLLRERNEFRSTCSLAIIPAETPCLKAFSWPPLDFARFCVPQDVGAKRR
jgi:hypothetical protein